MRSYDRDPGAQALLDLHGQSLVIDQNGAYKVKFVVQQVKPSAAGPVDHKHRMEQARPYRFQDAATLLADFWAEVDAYLKDKGVL